MAPSSPVKRNLSRAVRRAVRFAGAPTLAPVDPSQVHFQGRDPVERILMGLVPPPKPAPYVEPAPVIGSPVARPLVARFLLQTCDNCGHECFPFFGLFRVADNRGSRTYFAAPDDMASEATIEISRPGERTPYCPLCKGVA